MPMRAARPVAATNSPLITCERRGVDHLRRRLVFALRNRGRSQRRPAALFDGDQLATVPGPVRRPLATGVRQLQRDRHRRRIGTRNRETSAQCLFARIVVEAQTTVRYAADRRHGGGFDREHARTRLQQLSPMNRVPIGRGTIDRRVLAHRRHDDAIGELELTQRELRKQRMWT